jgi:ketosteroid isomerase-like protein
MIRAIALALVAWAMVRAIDPERAAIEKLRQEDIAATLTQNPDQLTALWDSDATLLGEGEAPVIGRTALRAAYAPSGTKCLAYTPHFESLVIQGPLAYEWGRFDATFQAGDSTPAVLHGRYLRIMKRQRDGSWRFTRVMWQQDKPSS